MSDEKREDRALKRWFEDPDFRRWYQGGAYGAADDDIPGELRRQKIPENKPEEGGE